MSSSGTQAIYRENPSTARQQQTMPMTTSKALLILNGGTSAASCGGGYTVGGDRDPSETMGASPPSSEVWRMGVGYCVFQSRAEAWVIAVSVIMEFVIFIGWSF